MAKLCEIGIDRYDEVMAAVVPIIQNLAKNEDFTEMMYRNDLDPKDKKQASEVMTKRIGEYLPKLMVSAKDELIAYFALLEGKSADEYKKSMNIGDIIEGITGMLSDKAFLNFFTLYAEGNKE